eukprot:SAG22_NODE_4006_length_1428_cov_1.188864_2_plen_73_part_00
MRRPLEPAFWRPCLFRRRLQSACATDRGERASPVFFVGSALTVGAVVGTLALLLLLLLLMLLFLSAVLLSLL